ncbi:uncharacterized protein STEHIDRAFT_114137 [Stereum hirsutum FP-91666 SS1]|uniref:uncharacterized protein n=1 Tax=Stereum hirsutum (strain FP-91666) TaxID=721885 RepID=UPI0004449695|nr:uncharacterized protein STEHIDRAFT_114137 [Stereum hirsutum FP-91666 SS1]EIM83125.1 hypothetical protein STEHIDRAFT_114137 [Stereum hirsutum FP-91666 SS1]
MPREYTEAQLQWKRELRRWCQLSRPWPLDKPIPSVCKLLWNAERWGADSSDTSTFLHLECSEVYERLCGEKEGFLWVRDRCTEWERIRKELDALQSRLSAVVTSPLLLESRNTLSRPLQGLGAVVTSVTVICMLLEEEVSVWCGEVQWKGKTRSGSNDSVKLVLEHPPGLEDSDDDDWSHVLSDPVLCNCTHIQRIILLIHNGRDHWITACIDFNTLSITVYDSWKPTYDRNHPEKKTGKGKGKKKNVKDMDHWVYVALASIPSYNVDTPCWDDWTFSPHERVPFQANSSDCGIFALLFVLHLRHGSFNHINLPVRFIAICKTKACECGAGLAVNATGPSSYNEGAGILVNLSFFPLEKKNTKKQKNAKPNCVNKKLAFHEDMELDDFLVSLCQILDDGLNLLSTCTLYHIQSHEPNEDSSLSISYSILGTSDKDISLESVDDYKTMVKDVSARGKPKLKVEMKQQEVEHDDTGSDSDSREEAENAPAAKKAKTVGLSPQETAIAERVNDLMDIHKCHKKTCKSTHCVLYGPDLDHGPLIARHFSEWGSAWEAGKDGIDAQTPPTGGIFDFKATQNLDDNTTDINLLASRRLRTATSNNTGPNVQMNFEGLANVLRVARGQENDLHRPANHIPTRPHIPPKMVLDEFCTKYELVASTTGKLREMELAGPHILRLLSNQDLIADAKLTNTQVAEVRDAEERWLADAVKDID